MHVHTGQREGFVQACETCTGGCANTRFSPSHIAVLGNLKAFFSMVAGLLQGASIHTVPCFAIPACLTIPCICTNAEVCFACTGDVRLLATQRQTLSGAQLPVQRPVRQRSGCRQAASAKGQLLGGKKVNKVVLAYSGGLDTSVILKWLQDTYDCEVVTFTADLGQVRARGWLCAVH